MAKRDWPAIHKSWQESGEPITNYCKKNGIAPSGFYGGIKKLGLTTVIGSRHQRSQRKFIKAVIPAREIFPVVVDLPNGLRISLKELSESVLTALLSVKGE